MFGGALTQSARKRYLALHVGAVHALICSAIAGPGILPIFDGQEIEVSCHGIWPREAIAEQCWKMPSELGGVQTQPSSRLIKGYASGEDVEAHSATVPFDVVWNDDWHGYPVALAASGRTVAPAS